ncbi:MAG: hypothetical protein CMI54_07170 [Parcubacteria group bacterium]|jgi:hypothetical protein|nr:hypothetical protein [Parcubacteria group bacterium]|tara:strand:- start:27102 stop:28244 length:1143 start_codon:yes stop_codon:yes gene_type:complete
MAENQMALVVNAIIDSLNRRIPSATESAAMDTRTQSLAMDLQRLNMEKEAQDSLALIKQRELELQESVTASDISRNELQNRLSISSTFGGNFQDMDDVPAGTLTINEKNANKELDRQYLSTYGVVYKDFEPGMSTLKEISEQKALDAYNLTHFGKINPGKTDTSFAGQTFALNKAQAAVIDTFKYTTQDGQVLEIPITQANASTIMGQDVENHLREYTIKKHKRDLGEYSSFKPHNVIHIPNLSAWRTGETYTPTHYKIDEKLKSKTLGSVNKIITKPKEKAWAKKGSLIGQIEREIEVMESQSQHVLSLWDSMSPSDQAVWTTSLSKIEEYLARWEYQPSTNWSMVGEDEDMVYELSERLAALKAKQKFAITNALLKAQ